MARLDETYDDSNSPAGSYDLLPAGWYTACITEAELKTTRDGNGQYISTRYDITGPEHQGRVVFANFNIRLPLSPEAEKIGRQSLGDLRRAIGIAALSDTDQLIGAQLQIKITIKENKEKKEEPRNEVRGFKSIGSAPAQDTVKPSSLPIGKGKKKPTEASEEKPLEKGKTPPWSGKK